MIAIGCAVLVALAGGCATEDEHAILIEAESSGSLETIDVVVVDLEGRRPPTRADARDVRPPPSTGDGAAPPPIRVVVRLDRPSFVLVHLIAHGAAERYIASRCYRVDGIVRDRVLLAGPLADDADGDSFPASAESWCLDPPAEMPVPCDYACGQTSVSDCNDTNPTINPAADDLCENRVDENCDGGDSACADVDGDSFTACRPDAPAGTVCDCDDSNASVFPGAPDPCSNGVDEDCRDGDAMCDGDMDNYPADRPMGGTPDCDDTNPAINPGAPENPGGVCDGIDNNCNGLVDEIEDCTPSDLDRDGAMACVGGCRPDCDCNDCDPGIRPGAPESCRNGIDANGDGTAPTCPSGDSDRDGYASTSAGGADCNDADPTVHPGAPDFCGDGVAQGCVADHPCGTDSDRDGFSAEDDCDDRDAERNPYATTERGGAARELPERCDGVDDDCDGVVDEVLDPSGARGCIFDARREEPTCTGGFCPIDFLTDWPQHCGGCRIACSLVTTDACIAGDCVCSATGSECASGTQCCRDGCKDLDSDVANCGGCGRTPAADLAPRIDGCTGGEFTCGGATPCAAGQICCGGACFPQFDVHHCGVCGNDCDQTGRSTVCLSGRCSCGAGGTACGGSTVSHCCGADGAAACTDLSRDPANCGTCGTAVDIGGDPRNCGGCLMACNPDRANECTGGTCTCSGEGRACGGDAADRCCPGIGCVDLRNDVANCGECGRRCAINQRCDAGRCVCETGFQDCDGEAGCESDRRIDTDHCGNCSTQCRAPTPSCVGGSCRACASAADCPDDGRTCTGSPMCVDSACIHPLLPGNCLIGGTCYADGAMNGANECQICDD
ncbi:MAG: hypothetical protein IT379_05885, partial [Deltaproteobacteria bacterium]|nr:hypothetical protein [Deltaproteobacteria bacterium]